MKNFPLVTVVLLAYNQEKFIFEAVNSILLQRYEPLQIIISDDCSTDTTYSIASRLVSEYTGPHEVLINRNKNNLGIGNHVNRVMELAEGELIVGAGGDDISFPDRVSEIVKMWLLSGKKHYSICSDMVVINVAGKEIQKLPQMELISAANVLCERGRWINGAAHAWNKTIFDVFGPLGEDVVSEDRVIGFRSLLIGEKIGYVEKSLVKYRSHSANVTSGSINLAMLRQKIATYKSFIKDLEKARSLGFLEDRISLEYLRSDLKTIYLDFVLRDKILSSGLVKAIFLLIVCGRKLSIQQKRHLFLKKLKGQENKVGWKKK